jgi:glycosyltransferase involved in cell wall biosynthesis
LRIAVITDAWHPQVNGVVTTLEALQSYLEHNGHQVLVVHPGMFNTRPCPLYPQIQLAKNAASQLTVHLDAFAPEAIHIATEGPLGWAARRYCLRRKSKFSSAFHTKFPELLNAACGVPVALGYWVMRYFHGASASVMVPTQAVLEGLRARGFSNLKSWTHGVDLELFPFRSEPGIHDRLEGLPRPISLFAGRVSYEKNIESFLTLNVPGTKVVAGAGPVQASLSQKYPEVIWLGMLPKLELSQAYASADVLVFPSKTDTFGLVMLEAMATGTPVAAYPVDGPMEVLQPRRISDEGTVAGGVMHEDLSLAWAEALAIPRAQAHAHAMQFDWSAAGRQFVANLVMC